MQNVLWTSAIQFSVTHVGFGTEGPVQRGEHAKFSGRLSLCDGGSGNDDELSGGHVESSEDTGIRYPGSPGGSVMCGPKDAGRDRNDITGSWSLT